MSSFSFNKNIVDQLKGDFKKAYAQIEKDLERKVNAAVTIVYTTARSRRPKISIQEQKALGRHPKAYRVSDPNASVGVPVRTGDLQISIKKDSAVYKSGKIRGRIYVEGPGATYAKFVEFGTSRMRARSFFRSALQVNKEWIKAKFKEKSKVQK